MDFIGEIFQYRFLGYAFLASLLSGITCGIVGAYIVSRRLVFMSGGITHASFGGIGIAYYLGLNPIGGALAFSLLTAAAMEFISGRGKMREDSAIGILWSVGMALGIVFIFLTPGYAPNMMSFLFGNILTVTGGAVLSLAILAAGLLLLMGLAYRPILYVAFDRDYSKSQKMPVKVISYLMAMVVAVTIVLSIRAVGIILLISLLTFPAVIAGMATKSYGRITLWAIIIGMLGNVAGLWISYRMDLPASAVTIFVLTGVLIVVKLLTLRSKKQG